MKNDNDNQKTKCKKNGISRKAFLKTSAISLAVLSMPLSQGCKEKVVHSDVSCLDGVPVPSTTDLFEPASIGNVKLRNRFVRSALSMMATDELGRPTDYLLNSYKDMCEGGVGMIITGMMDGGLLIDGFKYDPAYKSDYQKVSDLAHEYNVPIFNQISHQGGQTNLSGLGDYDYNKLTDGQINDVIDVFVEAIVITKELGFDGAQLHLAHGYLLSETLSPQRNQRTDKWGGTTDKRFTMVREIIQRARSKTGDFPIFAKINGYDFQKNGMNIEEAVRVAKLLENEGCGCIEVSSGTGQDGFSTIRPPEFPIDAAFAFIPRLQKMDRWPFRQITTAVIKSRTSLYQPLENYNVCAAQEIKNAVSVPVMVVGGIKKADDAKRIRAMGAADFISLGRSLIIEPDIVDRYKDGIQDETGCISCTYCLLAGASRQVECFYGQV